MTNPLVIQSNQAYLAGDFETSLSSAMQALDADINDPDALYMIGTTLIATGHRGMAYNILARALKHQQDNASIWIQYGRCQNDDPDGWAMSEYCFEKGLELSPGNRAAMENLGSLYISMCQPEKGMEWCYKALAVAPESKIARSALGFGQLMTGQWAEGWKNFHVMVGHHARPLTQYNDLPEWDGTHGQCVIVTGEQGIGDEILFASILPDLAAVCSHVVYDGMSRISPLLERSVPHNVTVRGTRWEEEMELPASIKPEAAITIPGACQWLRTCDEDFPGTPYLVADRMQRLAMRGMLDSFGPGPKIGIAWTGGTHNSRMQFRQDTLENLTPLLRIPGITWISLQYKDPSEEIKAYKDMRGISVHHFPWVTEAKDMDYTAAMVRELDLVISVPTSVTQLAAAMGIPAWVRVPAITGWLFSRDEYVWARCMRLFRDRPVSEVAQELESWLNQRQAA